DDDRALKIETDAGMQTRMLRFQPTTSSGSPRGESRAERPAQKNEPSWQGDSAAEWDMQNAGRGAAANAPRRGSLKVVTTNLRSGYLRKNGVPYSEDAKLTEYFDVIRERNGDVLLMVTTVVDDPKYLRQPFIVTTQFRKEADAKG